MEGYFTKSSNEWCDLFYSHGYLARIILDLLLCWSYVRERHDTEEHHYTLSKGCTTPHHYSATLQIKSLHSTTPSHLRIKRPDLHLSKHSETYLQRFQVHAKHCFEVPMSCIFNRWWTRDDAIHALYHAFEAIPNRASHCASAKHQCFLWWHSTHLHSSQVEHCKSRRNAD